MLVIPHICACQALSGFLWALVVTPSVIYSRAMPNRGTRVNLTLTPETDAVLVRLAAASGVGKATWVGQWLEQCSPQLVQLALAMEQANRGNFDAFGTAIDALRAAKGRADQVEMDLTVKRRAAMRKRKVKPSK